MEPKNVTRMLVALAPHAESEALRSKLLAAIVNVSGKVPARVLHSLQGGELAAVADAFATTGQRQEHLNAGEAWGFGKDPATFVGNLARNKGALRVRRNMSDAARALHQFTTSVEQFSIAHAAVLRDRVRAAAKLAIAEVPLGTLRSLSRADLREAEHIIEGMNRPQIRALAKKWGAPKGTELPRRWLVDTLNGRAHVPLRASTPAPTPAAAPKTDAHQWEAVKDKPGRRKRRLPSGRWHYEDVPMRKAGESMRDYIGRLCARVHELVP